MKLLVRHKVIWEARRAEESGNGVSALTGRGNTGFASETADETGETKQVINQYLARADKLAQRGIWRGGFIVPWKWRRGE